MQYLSNSGSVIAGEEISSEGSTTYLYNKDIQNSTKSLLKANGDGITAYDYSDFGETTITGNQNVGNEIAYTGGIYDESTGLYYLNARYYDPENGRFLTEDTYRGETDDPDTWHLYAYCNNDPVNYVDPSGHWFFALGISFSANFVFSYQNTVQVALDTKGNFTISGSKAYGVKIKIPSVSLSGFVMAGSGYVDSFSKAKNKKSFEIGADVDIGKFSASAGGIITKGSATAYLSGSRNKKIFGKSYLNLNPIKNFSVHAHVVCSKGIGKFSVKNFLKKKSNYKLEKKVNGKTVTITNKRKYIKVRFYKKDFKVYSNKIRKA
jgi:RHS repeat-associated protein